MFTVNALNGLTNVTRNATNALTVAGRTTIGATNVTVNGSTANLYADNTFAREGFTPLDGNNAFTAIAHDAYGGSDSNSIVVNLVVSTAFQYDLNGNLTNDSVHVLDYDDENQLVTNTVAGSWKSEFVYDGKMRRRIRREYSWQGGTWVKTNEVRYVYDGNLVLQERDSSNNPLITYTRGLDLSGSLQGVGGIGGLLALSQPATVNSQPAHYHWDGNGNVTALVNQRQEIVARYLYDPFGNTLSAAGPMAEVNLYRFSSKEVHPNSGLSYFLYRYYDSANQRWVNRDPLGEAGGLNPYEFVRNSPVNLLDFNGLAYGNPISGPAGPAGPADPYSPGGAYSVNPQSAGGWTGAAMAFGHWITGATDPSAYGPGSPRTLDMSESAVGQNLRRYFLNKNRNKLCADWVGVTEFKGSFGFREYFGDIKNGTSEFVGSARGDVEITEIDLKRCKVRALFRLTNTTSLTSLFYGKWPDAWNVTTPGYPLANWTQTYEWYETFDCKCCQYNLLSTH